jgi:hypothetical protein
MQNLNLFALIIEKINIIKAKCAGYCLAADRGFFLLLAPWGNHDEPRYIVTTILS